MKKLVYVCREESRFVLRDGAGSDVTLTGRSGYDAGVLSRSCVDTVFPVFPHTLQKELLPMIRFSLEGHYPAGIETVSISYISRRTRKGDSVTAFLLPSDHLQAIRALTGKLPLVPGPVLSLPTMRRTGDGVSKHILVYPDCCEIVGCRDGFPVESTFALHDELPEMLERVSEDRDKGGIFVSAPESMKESLLHICLSLPVPGEIAVHPFEASPSAPGNGVFRDTGQGGFRIGRTARIPSLAVTAAVLATVLCTREITAGEKTLSDLRTKYLSAQKDYSERSAVDKERDTLLRTLETLEAKTPHDVYALLSMLSTTLGKDAVLSSCTIRGNRFELEGIAARPFELVSKFDPGSFSTVEVPRITPLPDGTGSRFILSGNIR